MNKKLLIFLSVAWVITAMTAVESAPVLTPEQVKIFQGLSPAQQAAAMEALSKQSSQTPRVIEKKIAEPPVVKPLPAITDPNIETVADEEIGAPTLIEKAEEVTQIRQPLKPFGYDLFAGAPTTFAPATDIPVPVDFVIGPGDTVQVQLFGKENLEYELIVSREGQLKFPGIGPIAVAGLTFGELKSNLLDRIKRQMIGIKASITMGALRSIRVFVLGDANRPGSYTVSALSTMTNALFVSGGVRPIGSLRDIQLKRRGKIITRLDLYDLLLHGDTSGDKRLQPGDVIFIPPIGPTVGVAGEVKRPAIYEIKNEKTAAEAVAFAGGMLSTAYPRASQLERISSLGERTLIDLDLSTETGQSQLLANGDLLQVFSVLEKMESIVLLSGHVQRPGGAQWRPDMRLTDLIPSMADLQPQPDLNYAIIKREIMPDRRIQVIGVDLGKAFADPASEYNLLLKPRDVVIVFGLGSGRVQSLMAIVEQLREQASLSDPEPVVEVRGHVRYPGNYPLTEGMRVSGLMHAAYDLLPKADLDYAMISRETDDREGIRVFSVSLRKALDDPGGPDDPVLQPRDVVDIFSLNQDREEQIEPVLMQLANQARQGAPSQVVSIAGLVMSQGKYPLESGMRVSGLIRAAGNLSESAFALSAEVSRYDVVDGQYREIRHIPVDLEKVLAGDETADIYLQPYDSLHIKPLPEWAEQRWIELRGEIRFPGRYPIQKGEKLKQVLVRAGGLTDYAFPEGAVFLREELKRKESEQIRLMSKRLEADLAAMSLEKIQLDNEKAQSVGLAKSLLSELKTSEPLGRLVIDLPALLAEESTEERGFGEMIQTGLTDIVLKDGDKLYVPANTQEVTVIGEVQHATSHIFSGDKNARDYINLSGGITYKADEDRIYVVRANGAVIAQVGASWFNASAIRPGDTIVVPLDAERMKPITYWTNVSQIVYHLGIAAASWNAVGLF